MVSRAGRLLIGILLLLAPLSSSGHPGYAKEEDIIRYSKELDVSSLDPRLRSEPLADWLRSGPPRVEHVKWLTSPNCDEKAILANASESDLPLCVKISFMRGRVTGWLMIRVGTIGKAPFGNPTVKDGYVQAQDTPTQATEDAYVANMITRLSDLPTALDEASYIIEHSGLVPYTKALDVSKLDANLASERLDHWLRSKLTHSIQLSWGLSFDCGINSVSAGPTKESPLCVTVQFHQGDVAGWIVVEVGTFGKGISGGPQLKSVSVQPMSADEKERKTSEKLSDLPNLLTRVSPAVSRVPRR